MNKQNFSTCILLTLGFILVLNSCVNEEENRRKALDEKAKTEASNHTSKKDSINKVEQIKKIFFSLPSPIELTFLFKKEGIDYQADKLHDITARTNYNLSTKKALNLGVYGADLSYAGLFGKHEDAIEYYTTCQILAEEIGIGQTFRKEFISRIEKNAGSRDTLMQVISDFFLDNDSYLKDHRQQFISTYVLVGGWVEGLYLGTQMEVEESNAQGIRTVIAGQKYSLENLIILLNSIEESKELDSLKKQMDALADLFDQIDYEQQSKSDKNEQKVEKKDGKIILNTGISNTYIDDKTFTEIKNLVQEIRTSIIQ